MCSNHLMIGQHQSEFETPAICIDLEAFEESSRALARQLTEQGKRWRADVAWHLRPELAQLQRRAGAEGLALGNISNALPFIGQEVSSILLSHAPVSPFELQCLSRIASETEILIACDHFAQAEAVSWVAKKFDRPIQLLMDVNTGKHTLGVRPGLEARDLARGLQKLDHVQLCGLSTNLGKLASDTAQNAKRIQSATDMLEELRDHMTRDGIECSLISVAAEGDVQSLSKSQLITELRTGNRFAAAENQRPVVYCLASVISRPQLDRATVNAGVFHFGSESPTVRRTASGRELSDITVTSIDWETTTLKLGPESRELVIGDQVEIIPDQVPLCLRLNRTIYGVRDGIFKSI